MHRIDLHIHSNVSDGKLTGKEIIDYAKKHNVKTISITDHDTIDVYTKELIDYAKDQEINLIKGIEISTKFNKLSIHVLGYNIDIDNEEFKNKLIEIRSERKVYLYEVSKKINELGYVVNVEELEKIDGVTKGHIAKDIVENIKNRKLLEKEYGYIPKKGEFIETQMNPGCKAFVLRKTVSPSDAVKLIKKVNGTPVLAHPAVYNSDENMKLDEIIKLIKDSKVEGIESNYIYLNRKDELINQIDLWNNVAKELNLLTSVGSDFHEYNKELPEIGFTNYNDIYDSSIIKLEKITNYQEENFKL